MIYSRSTEYAIRAFVHLAQVPDGTYVIVKNIAKEEDIPVSYLSKILQEFTRQGLVRSRCGFTGGFALRVPARAVKLWDLVETLEGKSPFTVCACGLPECSDEMSCSMHDGWVSLRACIMDYLQRTTIADLANALDQKRDRLAKGRHRED